MIRAILLAISLLLAAPRVRADDAPTGATLRRFALLVGSNAGSRERKELRHALSDARAMAGVLGELGGVRAEDTALLANPDPGALERALSAQRERIARVAGGVQRTEFVFYYSGHSDDEGLRLGSALVPYSTLRGWLERVQASVRIVVLDSCASGSFTRAKGGVQVAPFLFDASIDVQGQAVLTASSESEAAQESDRLGGSFFTHYLVAGLRGAADASSDGRVTLTEAYRYAFDETLARTGRTESGAQHPSYDIRLSGTGDLVITDLRNHGARLVLAPELEGRVYVRDGSGRLLVELPKRKGQRTSLSLPGDQYALLLEGPGLRGEARVTLAGSGTLTVGADSFTRLALEPTRARGGAEDVRIVPVGVSFIPPFDNYHRQSGPQRTYFGWHALYGEPAQLAGAAFSLGGNGVSDQADGLLVALEFNRTRRGRGVALAGFANVSRTQHIGLSLAGLFNLARGQHEGVALSLGFNGLRRADGLSLAAVNVVREELTGVAAGALQLAEHVHGLSLGAVNWAGELRGLEAGGLNLARTVQGVQLGLINVAAGDVDGAQIGLVNYARSVDAGLAPFSITREGGVHAQVVSGTLALFQLALRFDARYTYSFLGGGVHAGGARGDTYLLGGGFGGKVPIVKRLSAELDGGAYLVQPLAHWVSGVPCIATELRVLARFEIFKSLSLLAGITIDVLVNRSEPRLYPGFTSHLASQGDGDVEVRYGPGWVAGLRF